MEFDDGDVIDVTEDRRKGRNIYTESEYWESTKTVPPPAPSSILQRLSDDHHPCHIVLDAINTPTELFQNRCNMCSLCQMKICGRCDTCRRQDPGSDNRTLTREICLRNVRPFYSVLFYCIHYCFIHFLNKIIPFHLYRCVCAFLSTQKHSKLLD